MRFVFATIVSARHFSDMFTEMDVDDRLLSYAELLYAPPDFLPHFVETGLHPPKVTGRRLRDETWDSPVPRVVNKKAGKQKPEPKFRRQDRHWKSEPAMKRRRLALIKRMADYREPAE